MLVCFALPECLSSFPVQNEMFVGNRLSDQAREERIEHIGKVSFVILHSALVPLLRHVPPTDISLEWIGFLTLNPTNGSS